MGWRIEWDEGALKDLKGFDRQAQRRIVRFMAERVATRPDPRTIGRALTGPLGEFWRYRVGPYRIVCRIEGDRLVVLVVRVGHRREVYRTP
ncbi:MULTISPECIES: type II toxin-antitoxin system RelE family toxin [Deferrisoma]